MTLFRRGNSAFLIEREYNEADEIFVDRGNFIASQLPKTENEYNKVELFSRIYVNVKYLGCVYDDTVMARLNKMIEKMNQNGLGK